MFIKYLISHFELRPIEGAIDVNDRLVPRGRIKRTNIGGVLTTEFNSKGSIGGIIPIL